VLIKGHADLLAGVNYNEALSQRRAEAVRARLLELGVAGHLLHLGAYGKSAPVDEDWTPEGRNRNRRVELYVLSHDR
jgi:OOP family OmpA-OmpF porin